MTCRWNFPVLVNFPKQEPMLSKQLPAAELPTFNCSSLKTNINQCISFVSCSSISLESWEWCSVKLVWWQALCQTELVMAASFFRAWAKLNSRELTIFFVSRLHCHKSYSNPCSVSRARSLTASTNRAVGQGLSRLWFTNPGTSMSDMARQIRTPILSYNIYKY